MKYLPLLIIFLIPQFGYANSATDSGFWQEVLEFIRVWGGRIGLLGFVWSVSLIIADYFFDWEWLAPIVAKHKRNIFYAIIFFGIFTLGSTFVQEIVNWIKDPLQKISF